MSREVEKPPAKTLPLSFWCLLSVLLLARCLPYVPSKVIGALLGALMVITFVFACASPANKLVKKCGLCLLVATFCFIRGSTQLVNREASLSALASLPVSRLEFVLEESSSKTNYGYSAQAKVFFEGKDLGRVRLYGPAALSAGEQLRAVGRFKAQLELDDYFGSPLLLGDVQIIRVLEKSEGGGALASLASLRAAVLKQLSSQESPGKAFVAALLAADKSGMKDLGMTRVFQRAGLAHLLSISGAQLSLITALLTQLLEKTKLKKSVRLFLVLVLTASFVIFCDSPVSALCAWLCVLSASLASLVGRRSQALASASACELLMLLADFSLAFNLSFLLSMSCVAGISLFSDYFRYLLELLLLRPNRYQHFRPVHRRSLFKLEASMTRSFARSLAALVATLPFSVLVFSSISPVALLSNLIAEPLLMLGFCAGAPFAAVELLLSSGVCTPNFAPVANSILQLLWTMLDFVLTAAVGLMRLLIKLPFAVQPCSDTALFPTLMLICCCVLLACFAPKLSSQACRSVLTCALVCMLGISIHWRYFAPARVCMLDIGQGDSILIQEKEHAVLIDTGPDSALMAALGRMHICHLDAVFLTHLHDDHIGGLESLVDLVDVDQLFVSNGVSTSIPASLKSMLTALDLDEICEFHAGDSLSFGHMKLECLWPAHESDGMSNADSLIISLSWSDTDGSLAPHSFLFCGDAEKDELHALLSQGALKEIELLKLGHHGSAISLDEELVRALSPKIVLISAGKDNKFGHPKQSILELLETEGAFWVCTINAGDIDVRCQDGAIWLKTQKQIE